MEQLSRHCSDTYLSEKRRETEAFKSLIENKASLVVPDAQDGKSGEAA